MNQSGYHIVSGGHKLYFEVCGNPDGIPVLFLHGGPGIGFSDYDKQFFDKKKFRVLFFDQRGASRSKPFGGVESNTTDALIEDIDALAKTLQFKKFLIFGGSWGSTLALVYAIRNPNKVLGLILRGIFLANKESLDYYINGGVQNFFPEVWEHFKDLVPKNTGDSLAQYYYDKMCSNDQSVSEKFAYEWARYEMSIYKMGVKDTEIEEILNTIPYKSLAKLEAHYMVNNCFISEDYILDNSDKIKDIPTVIVQGRYDAICPPKFAYQLHQKLKNSKLHIVNAGHAASEPEIEKKLIEELDDVEF